MTESPQRMSWARAIGLTIATCLTLGIVAYGMGFRLPSQGDSSARGSAQPEPRQSGSLTGTSGEAPASGPSVAAAPATGTAEPGRGYDGPPKVAVQISDTAGGLCPEVFSLSVNIYVVKGEVTDAWAVIVVLKDKDPRTLPLVPIGGDWSAVIGGIPTKRTARVVVVAKGPHGKATESQDITHECPGEPLDKRETLIDIKPNDNRIAEKLGDFEFDFGDDNQRPSDRSERS